MNSKILKYEIVDTLHESERTLVSHGYLLAGERQLPQRAAEHLFDRDLGEITYPTFDD